MTHGSKKDRLGRGEGRVGWRTLYGPPVGFFKGFAMETFVILGRTMPFVTKKGCLAGHFTKYLANSQKK